MFALLVYFFLYFCILCRLLNSKKYWEIGTNSRFTFRKIYLDTLHSIFFFCILMYADILRMTYSTKNKRMNVLISITNFEYITLLC